MYVFFEVFGKEKTKATGWKQKMIYYRTEETLKKSDT